MRTTTIATTLAAAVALALTVGCDVPDETQPTALSGTGAASTPARYAAEPVAQRDVETDVERDMERAQERAEERPDGSMMARMRETCPMLADGAEVEVSETDDGVALEFTSTIGDGSDLRTRVRHIADMYTTGGDRRGMMWHSMRDGQGREMMGDRRGPGATDRAAEQQMPRGMMPEATATVVDVEHGARVTLVPTYPEQLGALREHARMHQERMHAGDCPMLNPEQE